MEKAKIGDVVSINPNAVVCVGNYYDWVSVGNGAKGKVTEVKHNPFDNVLEAKVRLYGTKRSYWFYLDDLKREVV